MVIMAMEGSMGRSIRLTDRELDVLRLAEYSNKQVAHRLGISPQTVKNHWCTISRVLLGRRSSGHHRKVEVILEALRRDIIKLGEIEKGDKRCPREQY